MPTLIVVPDVPDIRGLHFRSIRGEDDADALCAVHAGRITRDAVDCLSKLEDWPSLDGLCNDLSDAIAAGEPDAWLVAQVNDRVVGYSQMDSWFEEDGVWVYLIMGWVLLGWRGQGIGTAMLHWGENRARRSAASQHSRERFEYAANASCTEQDCIALLRHEGYDVGFTTLEMRLDMSVPLPAVQPLPDGIEWRSVLPEQYPLIVSSLIDCYRHEYPGDRFRVRCGRESYFTHGLSHAQRDPWLLYVAWDGDQVAGQVFVTIENGRAEVDQVSIRPAWRRRGLGRALVTRAVRDAYQRGVQVIWLHTIAEYPTHAVDLYRSLGFHVIKEFGRYRKTPAQFCRHTSESQPYRTIGRPALHAPEPGHTIAVAFNSPQPLSVRRPFTLWFRSAPVRPAAPRPGRERRRVPSDGLLGRFPARLRLPLANVRFGQPLAQPAPGWGPDRSRAGSPAPAQAWAVGTRTDATTVCCS
jgi:mycothiol synthase